MYLEHIESPADVRALPASVMPALCAEIRDAIIASSAKVGGHVGPNLGIVELTVALHRVFHSPADKLVFDVSHQTYAHKMLTGRAWNYLDPTRMGTLSGFASPVESEHDHFSMGHTSTSVSLAAGLARARDLAGERYDVVAVIGDGSLSGGLAFEGLDDVARLGTGLIVVVNDNEWSISQNQGGLYAALAHLRETGGLGFAPAEADEESWHHVGPFDPVTGEKLTGGRASGGIVAAPPATYADITGEFLLSRMASDQRLIAISSATPYMMGLTAARRAAAGRQFVDVGIAEEHAVTLAAGLATGGAHPVYGVYGTFLQRAYDQIWHDVCLNAAPVTILVFGSSAFGTTDATHLGFYDIAMLGDMPGLTYLAPTCREEYLAMLDWACGYEGGPVAIRVPGAGVVSRPDVELPTDGFASGMPEIVHEGDDDVAILALGATLPLGRRVAERLAAAGVDAELVNPRFACGIDRDWVRGLAGRFRVVVTLEDGVRDGGFGSRIACVLGPTGARVRCFGLTHGFPDRYEPHELLEACGMTEENVTRETLALLGR